nr:substrate-binding domain-containing protein [Phytoactinopolyspora mesophila]
MAVLVAGAFGARELLSAQANSCDADDVVQVAAAPAIAATIDRLAAAYQEIDDELSGCDELNVVSVPGFQVAPTVGTPDGPDLWIPDSSLWGHRIEDPSQVEQLAHVASSPLVVVAPRSVASELGWPDGDYSWRQIIGDDRARMIDPGTTTEGFAGLLAVRESLSADLEEVQLVGALAGAAQSAVPSVGEAYDGLSAETRATALFPASEQSVIEYNHTSEGDGVVALYPVEGTFVFDFPAFAVPGEDASVPDVVTGFVGYLSTPEAVEQLHDDGFRSADGAAAATAGVYDGTQPAMPELFEEPEAAALAELSQLWAALSQQMRMLTVIDVSGSMNTETSGGSTRIELTRDAAGAAIELLAPTSEVGLWIFSVLLDPPNHHEELFPVARMDEETGEQTRFDELVATLGELPGLVGGGTALYDTTLAAFRHMNETYAPEKVNSVVLMTDGKDEDHPDSIGIDALLAALAEEFDPEAPVPIITIGISPEADMASLERISEATGTTAYLAENPEDIGEVFMRAMLERQCRPNC